MGSVVGLLQNGLITNMGLRWLPKLSFPNTFFVTLNMTDTLILLIIDSVSSS
jgi:hypothetical protein